MTKVINPEEKISAALGAFLFFIPLITGKRTEFVVFYMKQNFALILISILFNIIVFIPFIGTFIYWVGWLAVALTTLFLIYNAYNWEKFEIPVLTKITNSITLKIDFLNKIFSVK